LTVNKGRLRRGGALISLTGVAAVVAFSSADAFVGAAAPSGPRPTSDAPDLRSATIVRAPTLTSAQTAQIRYCFDQTLSAVPSPQSLDVQNYDSALFQSATSAAIDPADQACVIADYLARTDIRQGSSAVADPGAVTDISGRTNQSASEPLVGSAITPVAGSTTGPDLVSATRDLANRQITYTFDENLDPDGALAFNGSDFGFYNSSDDGNAPRTGGMIIGIDGPSVTVGGFTSPINSAQLFFVAEDAVTDQVFGGSTTTSTIGATGTNIPASPGVVSAVKEASNQVVDVTFSQNISLVAGGASNVVAYREDGTILNATSISTLASNTKVAVTFPNDAQNDPASVVRIGLAAGAVTNQAGDNSNTFGAAALGTSNMKPGLTDGPDLLSTSIDDANNRATFAFDEAVQDPSVSSIDETEFLLLNQDGSTQTGSMGSGVVSPDQRTVSILYTGSVSTAVGVANNYGAIEDDATPNSNTSPEGNVGVGPVMNPQPGTTPPGTTPPGTTPPGTTPPGTTPPGTTIIRRKTRVSIRRRSGGRRYTGKVSAKSPCRPRRTVRLFRGSKKIKTTKSKSSGSYSIRLKKRPGKRVRVKVSSVTRSSGGKTFRCGAASSKRVKG